MRLLVGLGFFERGDLRLGEDQLFLRHLGFERFQTMFHRRKVVAQPDRPHAKGRHADAFLGEFVGDARLAPGRLVDRHGHDRRLGLGRGSVLQQRLAARQLLQRLFAAFVVEVLEAIEAVAAVAHDLAGLADVAELLGQFEQAPLARMTF